MCGGLEDIWNNKTEGKQRHGEYDVPPLPEGAMYVGATAGGTLGRQEAPFPSYELMELCLSQARITSNIKDSARPSFTSASM